MADNVMLEKALELIKDNNFQEAKEILTEIISQEPDNFEAIRSLGLCNVNLNILDEALVNFQKCIDNNPEDALSWYYKGTILELKNDLINAKQCFLQVIVLREDYVDAYKSLAVIYLKMQQNDKVIEMSEKLLELANEDYQAFYITGIANMGIKNYTRAIELFEKAIEINPNHAVLYNNLGTALMSLQNITGAVDAFLKAIEIEPETPVSYYNAGVCFQIKEKHKGAFEFFKKAYELNPSNFHLNALATAAFNAQMWEEAIKYYNALISANPEKQNYQYNLACAYQAIREYSKAISLLENLNIINTKTTQIAEKLAEVYIESDNLEAAKSIYANIMNKGKVSSEIYYQYAMLCAKTNDMDKAENILKKVLLLEPNNSNAHKDLGIIYLSKRLFDYAKDEFMAAYELEPNNKTIIFELANYWHLMSNHTEAQKYYDLLIESKEIEPSMYLPIGMNFIALNNLDKATEILTEALKYNPQNVEVLHNLAKIYYITKDFTVSKQLLEDAYFVSPTPETANSLASVNFELEEYEEANKLYLQINQSYPNNVSNLINIAKCQMRLKNNEKAKEFLEEALKCFPESEEAQELLESVK